MRWNRRLDIPPPRMLLNTSSAYLRRSANGTVSVAITMCVCAVSRVWRVVRPRTAAGTGGRGGGAPFPPPPPFPHPPSPIPREPPLLPQLLQQPLVSQVSRRRDHAVPGEVRLPVETLQVVGRQRAH